MIVNTCCPQPTSSKTILIDLCSATSSFSIHLGDNNTHNHGSKTSMSSLRVIRPPAKGLSIRDFYGSGQQKASLAANFDASQVWSRVVIDHELVSRDLHREKVFGDEHGLQGRFQQSVGQIVVPWVQEHALWDCYNDDRLMRKVLAQPIQYMVELDVKYGWISTYEYSIFLRQTYTNNSGILRRLPLGRRKLTCPGALNGSHETAARTPTSIP
ncbi:hypothetical protein PENPOL_c020G10752 [Penicillium polonicum]|uniref:Uncharacterized protein n=1 Tax=Penicillium polonicum TaxID=60169 RepID=A0A1V6N7W7_PENPO|nr:hypothetical protein PENPOL_c020G10752 [Penicillium polonicum]